VIAHPLVSGSASAPARPHGPVRRELLATPALARGDGFEPRPGLTLLPGGLTCESTLIEQARALATSFPLASAGGGGASLPGVAAAARRLAAGDVPGARHVLAVALPAAVRCGRVGERNVTGVVQEVLREAYAVAAASLLERAWRVQFVSALKQTTRTLLEEATRTRAEWSDAAQGKLDTYRAPTPFVCRLVNEQSGAIYTPVVPEDPAGGEAGATPTPPTPLPRDPRVGHPRGGGGDGGGTTTTPEPSPVPGSPRTVSTLGGLDAHIKLLEQSLSSLGEDSQLASVTLQAELQRQTQTAQLLATVSKLVHDTVLAILRKAGS
jgi:hypothetical protein